MKVLIIGGYGTFGFNIAERLANEVELELILAGRNLSQAKAACQKLAGKAATVTPMLVDRANFKLSVKPDMIVDASGPFQRYSVSPLADYCIQHGIHYADLSDNSIETHRAKTQYSNQSCGSSILAFGLSTCPVLSAVGLREVENAIGPATDVTIGIAPSPKANLGLNVVAAAANYAGQKTVNVLKNGTTLRVAGLTEVRSETISVPGCAPLPRLPFAVADAADALVLPDNFPSLTGIWTGAGTRPIWLHRLLVYLATGVGLGVLPKLSPFAKLFHRSKSFFRFGSHRGGMFVRASNANGEASWHLVAEGDDGPRIPALPVVALIRKILHGNFPAAGSYSGDQLISFDHLKPEFGSLDISYGLHYDGADLAVYEKVLGDAYQRLAPAVIEHHRAKPNRHYAGRCKVTRGQNPLSHIVAAIVGFPASGDDLPVTVIVTPDEKGELWTRKFGDQIFKSHHSLACGRWARHVTEKFGPISIHMAILEEEGRLKIQTQGWSFLGIPLPKFLKPGGKVYETENEQGQFVFYVDIKAPIFGRLCKYEGWLDPIDMAV